ncbi:MAG TPA: hypothetical protein VMW48_11985, partial [Vicinamibacterales bacterium]|nr:hypothetical protein [Vicinamibacterales bacterium]
LNAVSVRAEPLDPNTFVSGGPFPVGAVAIDTDALSVNGSPWPNAGVLSLGADQDVAVFTFHGDSVITGNVTLNGSLPAVVLFRAPVSVSGTWTVNAGRRTDGPGKGSSPVNGGGGGGGFGGNGGKGATASGGMLYGGLGSLLESGSGGGGVLGPTGAKLGGGAIKIGVVGAMDLSGAVISANGENGTTVFQKGSGGGSGGGIFLHAFTVVLNAATQLRTQGGNGGNGDVGNLFPGGGGGGGGRIAILRNTAGSYTSGGALFSVSGGSAGATGQGSTAAGSVGAISTSSSPTVGLPEPERALLGLAALATLALRRRSMNGMA